MVLWYLSSALCQTEENPINDLFELQARKNLYATIHKNKSELRKKQLKQVTILTRYSLYDIIFLNKEISGMGFQVWPWYLLLCTGRTGYTMLTLRLYSFKTFCKTIIFCHVHDKTNIMKRFCKSESQCFHTYQWFHIITHNLTDRKNCTCLMYCHTRAPSWILS